MFLIQDSCTAMSPKLAGPLEAATAAASSSDDPQATSAGPPASSSAPAWNRRRRPSRAAPNGAGERVKSGRRGTAMGLRSIDRRAEPADNSRGTCGVPPRLGRLGCRHVSLCSAPVTARGGWSTSGDTSLLVTLLVMLTTSVGRFWLGPVAPGPGTLPRHVDSLSAYPDHPPVRRSRAPHP